MGGVRERFGCISFDRNRPALVESKIGGHIDDHRRIADRVRGQKKLLSRTTQAIVHRPDAETIGDHFRSDTAGSVIDHKNIADRFERLC